VFREAQRRPLLYSVSGLIGDQKIVAIGVATIPVFGVSELILRHLRRLGSCLSNTGSLQTACWCAPEASSMGRLLRCMMPATCELQSHDVIYAEGAPCETFAESADHFVPVLSFAGSRSSRIVR
jgi:hypothetical protein